ncbi:MAG: hypothetical protein J7498_06350 [Sphingobium sp.]|nr:hypothetical protein [Sphingobium sp.]
MKPVDFVKALSVAILVMALDLVCAFCAVSIWAMLTGAQGLAPADPKVIEVSSLSTRICGPLLFALLVWIFQRKRPDRNAFGFAFAVFGFYLLIDWGVGALAAKANPLGPSAAEMMLQPAVLATMALKLLGALMGGWLARPRRRE